MRQIATTMLVAIAAIDYTYRYNMHLLCLTHFEHPTIDIDIILKDLNLLGSKLTSDSDGIVTPCFHRFLKKY